MEYSLCSLKIVCLLVQSCKTFVLINFRPIARRITTMYMYILFCRHFTRCVHCTGDVVYKFVVKDKLV